MTAAFPVPRVIRGMPCRAHMPAISHEVAQVASTLCRVCHIPIQPCPCIKNDEPSQYCRACNGTGWVEDK